MQLSQIILYVENMPNQVAFYRDVMGLTLSHPLDISDFSAEQWVTFAAGACSLALHAGDSKRFGKDAPKLVFQVHNIQQVRDALVAKGVEISEVFEVVPQTFVCDSHDPEFSLKELRSH